MLPQNTFCSGASFVPKPGGVDEDDGWIITFTHNENENISQVCKNLLDELFFSLYICENTVLELKAN